MSDVYSRLHTSFVGRSDAMIGLKCFGLAVAPTTNRPPYVPISRMRIVSVSAGSGCWSTRRATFAPPQPANASAANATRSLMAKLDGSLMRTSCAHRTMRRTLAAS
ncbi:MAG: hypothetical protein IPJ04_10910 [Candidatus Eisenbacteria bacterium]|nr:hypothetical protein [Candidatus Eisenbacteria bacterium]